jgi:RNA polymerase sigma-70 factor, ECF subfamily
MSAQPGIESTTVLLNRARKGDTRARDTLAQRYQVLLTRWAHGRVPASARGLLDTSDLVQTALMRGFHRLDQFEPRREGAFLAYLRQIILNRIRDEARRGKRRPPLEELPESVADPANPSPLETVIGSESMARYDRALADLTERQREAIILRLELGFRYREVAEALDAPSVNAARLIVARALVRLAAVMQEEDADAPAGPEREA